MRIVVFLWTLILLPKKYEFDLLFKVLFLKESWRLRELTCFKEGTSRCPKHMWYMCMYFLDNVLDCLKMGFVFILKTNSLSFWILTLPPPLASLKISDRKYKLNSQGLRETRVVGAFLAPRGAGVSIFQIFLVLEFWMRLLLFFSDAAEWWRGGDFPSRKACACF